MCVYVLRPFLRGLMINKKNKSVDVLCCTKVCQSVLGCTKVYQSVLGCIKVYHSVLGYIKVYKLEPECNFSLKFSGLNRCEKV